MPGGKSLTLVAGIMAVRLGLFLLLAGTGKALRYVAVTNLAGQIVTRSPGSGGFALRDTSILGF